MPFPDPTSPQPVQPPDMVGAGIMQPQAPQASVIDALRSGGNLPSEIMGLLVPPTTPGQAYASAAAGGVAAMRGQPNPVAQQQQAAQHQQMQQAQMMERMQERRKAEAAKRNEQSRTVLKDILFGPHAIEDPALRGNFAKQYAKELEPLTGPIPPGTITVWGKGGPSQANQKTVAEMLMAAEMETEPQAKQSYSKQAQEFYTAHGGSPQEWSQTSKLLTSPGYLKSVGLPDRDALIKSHADSVQSSSKAWVATHPQFADTDDEKNVAGYADEFSRRVMGVPLQSLGDGPDDQPKLAAARAYAKVMALQHDASREKKKLEVKQAESNIVEAREARMARLRADLKLDGAGKKFSQTEANRALAPIDKAATAMAESNAMRASIDRADAKGLLPKGTGIISSLGAQAAQWWNFNDTDVRYIKQFVLPYFIGLVDRGLNDEKGTRAMAMFMQQLDLVQRTPTKVGFQALFDLTEYMFAKKAADQLRLHERVGSRFDQDVLAEERERFQEVFPKGVPLDPSAPKTPTPAQPGSPMQPATPKGSHMEQGQLVSDDGKYVWRDMTWQKR